MADVLVTTDWAAQHAADANVVKSLKEQYEDKE